MPLPGREAAAHAAHSPSTAAGLQGPSDAVSAGPPSPAHPCSSQVGLAVRVCSDDGETAAVQGSDAGHTSRLALGCQFPPIPSAGRCAWAECKPSCHALGAARCFARERSPGMCRAGVCYCSAGGQLLHQDQLGRGRSNRSSPSPWKDSTWHPCTPSRTSLPAPDLTLPNSRRELDCACLLG